MRKITKKLLIILVICSIVITYTIYLLNTPFYKHKKEAQTFKSTTNKKIKYVLYWTPFWKLTDFLLGFGFKPFESCKYKNCYATNNRTFMPLKKFDALMFHGTLRTWKKEYGTPWIRKPHQIYIFMNVEAPIHSCPNLKPFNSFYNWTMTYRFDSDIVRRHGYVIKAKTNYTMPSKEFVDNKTKLAAWFVSKCKSASRRETLGKEIKKYIPVDVYGACGKLQCAKKNNTYISTNECYDMAEKKYKFYFSFENSYCKDYVTEKLYNILLRDIVPVTYGAGNYALSAPPNSIVNVADFKTVKELTDYLRYLDQDTEEYLKYFKWKKNYQISRTHQLSACQICKKLNEPLNQTIYHNLYEWWWGTKKDPICKTGKQLPKIIRNIK